LSLYDVSGEDDSRKGGKKLLIAAQISGMEEIFLLKQKRNIGKTMLSFCLAVLLVLQTVVFPATGFAESSPDGSGMASVSEAVYAEPDEPAPADEPSSAPEAVYAPPVALAFAAMAADPTDKTAVFMEMNESFPLEVVQNEQAVAPGGTIQGRQPFTLKSEGLKVPVKGDFANTEYENDTTKYIQKGDSIELKRDPYFKEVVLPTATKTLMATTEFGPKQLGTAYFTPDSIKIVFNGDDSFFNGVGRAVTFGFETTADADVKGMEYDETKPITIFGGAYQLKNPNITPAYAISLRSMSNNQTDYWRYSRGNTEIKRADFVEGVIQWKADVSASDKDDVTIPVPLDGTKFSNDLTKVGVYVENSFQVLDSKGNPVSATPTYSEGKLSYTFPAGFGDKATISFKTWIPKEKYYYEYRDTDWGYRQTIYNFAQLYDSTDQELVNSKKAYPEDNGWGVGIKPDWIQATASYDHPNETITWTIVANQYNKEGLKNFTITNALPTGLEFTSATWQTWVDGVASEVKSITPDDSVYSFGDIDGKVQLVIKSKVLSGSTFKIEPRANWNLDTPGGIQNNDVTTGKYPAAVTDEATVTVGAHTFTKSGAISLEDYNLAGVTWTVNLAPQYALPNAVVYDVLVHGGDLNVLDNAVDETGEVDTATIAKIKANSTGYYTQLWKQYRKDTLKSADNNLTLKAIPLTVDGKVVADLIKVTGYTDKPASFSFRSVVTNPDVLFRQNTETSKWQYNRALLFDGGTVKTADSYVALYYRMLSKDMLTASYPIKSDGTADTWYVPGNANRYIGYDGSSSGDEYTLAGYDRATKTVTFRLSVNTPGYNTVEMAKDGGNRVITNVKLVDTLPEGWEFVPFSEEKEFELWKGSASNSSVRNIAMSVINPNDPAHVVSFSHSGNEGIFTFSKLEGPYVILVKARPSNVALEKYLEEYTANGTDRQVVYNKADLHMTWGGVEKVRTEQRKVIVPIQTLGKSVTKPVPGVLEWTVNYTPPFNMEQGVYLQDTLGAGMNLRYEADGKLVLTAPSMAVYHAKLTASGALEKEGPALNLSDPNAEVQVEAAPGAGGTTVLTFKMNDPNKFYQFVYQTEVDTSKAKAGDKMGNEVKLVGDDKLKSVSAKSESTLDSSDVAGSSSSNALLPLKKVDPDGNPLKDVEFTLYKKDDGTQIAKGLTGNDGKLNLLFPNPGYYELKETYIDTTTWLPTTRIYQVYVGNTPGKPIWVDGIKVDTNNPLIVPTPAQGKLTITNKVEGNGSDPDKEFEYTVTFNSEGKDGEYIYQKSDNTSGKIKSGDKITLKHGQTATLPMLPANLVYTVTEADYTTVDGYTTKPETRELSGTIVFKGDHKADFINERIVSKLTISNTVMGNGADKTKEFEYTISFEDTGKEGSYSYEKSDGSKGMIKSGGTFKLKDGETLDILDLPKNLKYTVTQTDYTTDEYVTTPQERYYAGVMEGDDEVAPFTNIRLLEGDLLISNTVKGKDDDKQKPFRYTIAFTGDGADKSYAYKKSDGTTGMIKSGEIFELTDGQTFIVQGLPTYLQYTVTQDDYTQDGYVTDPKILVHTGTIPEKKAAEAHFVNTRPYLEGVLRDNNTGEVIPNASITVTNLKTGEQQTIQTDEKGEYSVIAEADTDYTITFTKWYQVGGKDVPVEFTQKAIVDSSVIDETVPADITAVGIVLLKQPEGQASLLGSELAGKTRIYLQDANGQYVVDENGAPKAFDLQPNGAFSAEGLAAETYKMEVRYEVAPGKELTIQKAELDVKANGELNISQELVDPYGVVYDASKGITTGQIEGATVTLYYADTERNRLKGIDPGTKVTLPTVPGFPPHDNKSPEQDSDAAGFYAYMVFPQTDYYLVVTKPGYETYTSETISVDFDIVKYNVPMKPISSGGGGGGTGPVNPGPDPVNPDPVNPEPEPAKPEPENPVPGDGGNGTGGGGSDKDDNGTDKDDNEVDNDSNGTNNVENEADNENNVIDNNVPDNIDEAVDSDNNVPDNVDDGADKVNNGADNDDNIADDVNNGAGNVDNGANNVNNEADTVTKITDNVDNGTRKDDTGSKLPNTATNMFSYLLAGFIILIAGLFLLRRKKHN
jgi:LPXTG-motif cell wall-anchored protein